MSERTQDNLRSMFELVDKSELSASDAFLVGLCLNSYSSELETLEAMLKLKKDYSDNARNLTFNERQTLTLNAKFYEKFGKVEMEVEEVEEDAGSEDEEPEENEGSVEIPLKQEPRLKDGRQHTGQEGGFDEEEKTMQLATDMQEEFDDAEEQKRLEEEEATMRLIAQLEEQETEAIKKLREDRMAEDEDAMKCPVCFEEYADDNIFPLSTCEHVFHEDCLKYYLEAKIKEQAPKVPCPQDGCGIEMAVGDL